MRFNKNFSIVKSHTQAILTRVNSNKCHQKKRLLTKRDGQLFIDIATEKHKQIFPVLTNRDPKLFIDIATEKHKQIFSGKN